MGLSVYIQTYIETDNTGASHEMQEIEPGNSTTKPKLLSPGQLSFYFKQKLLLLNKTKKIL